MRIQNYKISVKQSMLSMDIFNKLTQIFHFSVNNVTFIATIMENIYFFNLLIVIL